MRLFDSLFRRGNRGSASTASRSTRPGHADADPPNNSDQIRVFDKFGRELFITKERWRTDVLPGMLTANSGDPEQLSGIIIGALADGFFPDVLEAAEHLHRIDPVISRGACVYGIALMKNQHLSAAERIFRSYLEKHGEDGAVLTNLAKVYAARNETEKSDATLWRALEIDPNQENGLAWYVSMLSERSGKEAAVEAWQRVAAIPQSWRAQLWLARKALESHNPEQAVALYRESLSRAGNSIPADLLMQMSGDLGNHGLLEELLQLGEPRFVPESHGLRVGNNLIKANLELGRLDNASTILNQLFALKRPDWKEQLNYWDAEIAKARIAKTTRTDEAPLKGTMLIVEGPVWLNRSSPASRLFPAKSDGQPTFCLLGCTAETATQSETVQCQLTNASGRMSRALPLFFAEQIEFLTAARARTLVPFADTGAGGFILCGAPWSDEGAVDFTKQSHTNNEYVVIIHLVTYTEPWEVRLRLVRVIDQKGMGNLSVSFPSNKPEESIPEFSRLFISLLARQAGVETQAQPPFYQVPEGGNLPDYLLRLEQLLAVQCAGVESAQVGFLSGEREILSGTLNLCLACPDNVTTRVLLIQTLSAMKKVRPDVLSEFQDKAILLQDEHPFPEPAQSVSKQLLIELCR